PSAPPGAEGSRRRRGRGPILPPGRWSSGALRRAGAPGARVTNPSPRSARPGPCPVGRRTASRPASLRLIDVGDSRHDREGIPARAKVSKPIVYEHFGGKEGLYAVVVDREVSTLLGDLERSLADQRSHPRVLMERAALAFLSYIDENEDGFRILVRDSPVSH